MVPTVESDGRPAVIPPHRPDPDGLLSPEAGMRLHRPPRQPREQAWVVSAVGRVPDDWKPYLALAS